jgi:hypothetical protein
VRRQTNVAYVVSVTSRGGIALAQYSTFSVATSGCAAAHCSSFAGGQDPLPPPVPPTVGSGSAPGLFNNDTDMYDAGNSTLGLGCVSNNTYVACTYNNTTTGSTNLTCATTTMDTVNPGNTLAIYSMDGGPPIFKSGCDLDGNASWSVPLMDTNGDVIIADDQRIIRYNNSSGTWTRQWCMTTTPGSTPGPCSDTDTLPEEAPQSATMNNVPYSPILLDDGLTVVIATSNPGWISAFWNDTGGFIAQTQITGACAEGTCYYETRNTPAASYYYNSYDSYTRFYVSMNAYYTGDDMADDYGMLVAIDVNTSGGAMTTGWSSSPFTFGGPSGASPAVRNVSGTNVIYFDGDYPTSPTGNATCVISGTSTPCPNAGYIFAVEDGGSSPGVYWSTQTTYPQGAVDLGGGQVRESGSIDTDDYRNCLWEYASKQSYMQCLDLTTGNLDNSFNVRDYSSLPLAVPASSPSLTHAPNPVGSGTVTVMILGLVPKAALDNPEPPGPMGPGHVIAVWFSGSYLYSDFTPNPYWGGDIELAPGEFAFTQFPIVTYIYGDTPYPTIVAFPTNKNPVYYYSFAPSME